MLGHSGDPSHVDPFCPEPLPIIAFPGFLPFPSAGCIVQRNNSGRPSPLRPSISAEDV